MILEFNEVKVVYYKRRRIRSFLILIITMLITSLVNAPKSIASINDNDLDRTEKNVVLPRDQVIDSDYFTAGRAVTISGSVKGDAYISGATVDIEGMIDGDLIVAGGVVNIRGTVLDDLRLAGGQVIISGDIRGNATVAGGSITLTDSANIGGSFITAGGNVNIFGPVGENARIGAGSLTIANKIGGNVDAAAGEIKLTSSASIAGDLEYYSSAKVNIQEGADIAGEVVHKVPTKISPAPIFGAGFVFLLIFDILSALIVGLLILKFYPNYINTTVDIIQSKTLNCLGIGLLGVVITPIIVLILLFTIIGIPLGVIIIFSYLIYIYLTKIFISLFIGRRFLKLIGAKYKTGWILLIGLIIFVLLTSIPFIGGIIYLLLLFLGFGALLLYYKQIYSKLRSEKVV